MRAVSIPSVSIATGHTGRSTNVNEIGMRPMQERVYQMRGEQYLLIKSPPASGKSRALMYVALDKLANQGVKQALIVVPERSIGASFGDEPLMASGFWADWIVKPRWNLCNMPGADDDRVARGKVKAVGEFLASEDKALVCTHATFRFALEELGAEAFDDRLIAIDEFHHVSTHEDNRLGSQLKELLLRDKAHVVAMTGSYFRGDAMAVLSPEDEARFQTVVYTYYEQLNGYQYLKSLDIGYWFYTGSYLEAIEEVLNPALKTIVHIPSVNSSASTTDKHEEVGAILSVLGEWMGRDEETDIAFTTFHQSIGYEEFVEGLRPVVGEDDPAGTGAGGFRLEARNGIFREVCAQAEAAMKRSSSGADYDFAGRTFYKMSLGQTGIDDDIYEAALKGDYIVLGWGGDEDWSDPRYKDYTAVLARWAELGKQVTGNSGDVIQVARFRSMEVGDIVIVPEGNTRFRAIGQVDGDYTFAPGTIGGNHRRKVKWLVKLAESLPLETIYNGNFAQAACYLLTNDKVKLPALTEMVRPTLAPGTATAAPYVLIIDEINRANISKVLGELITLLEQDKRLGMLNEITLTLPYSKARFGVPKNLYLIGTMNTADRSIAPIDTALRRRFDFVPMMPDYTVLAGKEVGGVRLDWLLKSINDRIEWLFDRDHQLGHAFFVGVETKSELDRVMRKKVVPLLAEYFYEDWAKVRSALNDKNGSFVLEEKLISPQMESDKETRMRYSLVDGAVSMDAYQAAIGDIHA